MKEINYPRIVAFAILAAMSLGGIPASAASTAVWPPGTWLGPPGQNATPSGPQLAFGKIYFAPVLLPANASVTKLAVWLASAPDNSGQKMRLCLYTSNPSGMPANLKVDGGETILVFDVATRPPTVVNFASVTTGGAAIFWVAAELKQPSGARFFSTSGVADSALAAPVADLQSGFVGLFAPMSYGTCPGVAPTNLSSNYDNTVIVGIGH